VETVNEDHATIGLDNGWRRKEGRLRTFCSRDEKEKAIAGAKGGASCVVQMRKKRHARPGPQETGVSRYDVRRQVVAMVSWWCYIGRALKIL
jgi:hypothetical protein